MELIFPTKKKLLNNLTICFVNFGSELAETKSSKHQIKPFDRTDVFPILTSCQLHVTRSFQLYINLPQKRVRA